MALAPSSPRLPSPPPPAEIQASPNSPSGGAPSSPYAAKMEQSVMDANSRRRTHPGTKAADMAAGPPLVPLSELDSAFQLQEHLAALHNHHTASGTEAVTRDAAVQLAQPPPGIDRTIWLYELCRFLISQCNSLIVGFLFDAPPCSATTCPEMRASEWQFLCAVHEQPKSCCAIDYCCHTLDWAANIVSDQKLFPSRFAVFNEAHNKNSGVKNLVNIFRRLHRIFAHAWFQHRSVFWSTETQTGLYVLFKMVCDLYDLLPAENYKLPPEAEGLEGPAPDLVTGKQPPPPTILKPTSPRQKAQDTSFEENDGPHSEGLVNTRRHIRSSPSTGSAVTTVMEADEEDSETMSSKLDHLHISGHHEPEVAEVPVIVEQSVIAEASKDLSQTESASESLFEPQAPEPPKASEETDEPKNEAKQPVASEEETTDIVATGSEVIAEPTAVEVSVDEEPVSVQDAEKDEMRAPTDFESHAPESTTIKEEPVETEGSGTVNGETGPVTDSASSRD